MSTRLPAGWYGLELFSGHGSVSRTAQKVLGIPILTIDISDEFGTPTFLLDISDPGQVVQKVEQYVASEHLTHCCFVWASVPCPEYSRNKTVGVRDLKSADALVLATRQIYLSLGAQLLIIENPGTGLLDSRDVISFIPKQQVYDVDYCQYGFNWQKHTKLFSTKPLPGFQPQQCPNHHQKKELYCAAAYRNPETGSIRHVWEFGEMDYGRRIAVPDRLINQISQSVLLLLRRSATAVAAPTTAVGHNVSAEAPTSPSDSPSSESHSLSSDLESLQAAQPSTPSAAYELEGPATPPAAATAVPAAVARSIRQPGASPNDQLTAAPPTAVPSSPANCNALALGRGPELHGTAAAVAANADIINVTGLQAAAAAKLQRWSSRLFHRPVEQQHKAQQQLQEHQDRDALGRYLGQALEQQQQQEEEVSERSNLRDSTQQRHNKKRQQPEVCEQLQEQQNQQCPRTPQHQTTPAPIGLNTRVHDVYRRQGAVARKAKRPHLARRACQPPQLKYIEGARLVNFREQGRHDLLLYLKLSGPDDLVRVWLDDLGAYCGHTDPTECQFGSEKAQQQVCNRYAEYCRLAQQL